MIPIDPCSAVPEDWEQQVSTIVKESPILAGLLARWQDIDLPDCWLSGSALAQTLWNQTFGFAPDRGVTKIDLVYFDPANTGGGREVRQAKRVRSLFPEIPIWIDAKNQARVHFWYKEKFGYTIPPHRSSRAAISTFPTTASSIGIRPEAGRLTIFAPFGVADLLSCTVRPNKTQIIREIYDSEIARWRKVWPGLHIIDWNES
ncbi:nucleotidyltransferase family protein [Agrobacterium rosae]|uniref:Nucleotidyltransferase family protein n=1 Tax=Agrobacterium rosae TaxID=1972867 RepID=A0A1R3U3A2_9HYPH|nr:nucleotidyltransferase family protein [Agrobacterium rosae]SCX36151.1 hypothetical protein DSM25559_5337 [Agrobacterium rosae]